MVHRKIEFVFQSVKIPLLPVHRIFVETKGSPITDGRKIWLASVIERRKKFRMRPIPKALIRVSGGILEREFDDWESVVGWTLRLVRRCISGNKGPEALLDKVEEKTRKEEKNAKHKNDIPSLRFPEIGNSIGVPQVRRKVAGDPRCIPRGEVRGNHWTERK